MLRIAHDIFRVATGGGTSAPNQVSAPVTFTLIAINLER